MPHRTNVRRTKIVATLGPATSTPEAITQLLERGADVFRVNASHGTPESRQRLIDDAQRIIAPRKEAGAILVDLHRPRIRVGSLAEIVVVKE